MGGRIFIVVAVLAAVACSDLGPTGELAAELERAERAWRLAGPDSYEYAVERLCFCGLEARGPVRVRVENGAVTARSYVDSGQPVPAPLAEGFPGVEGLFDTLRDAIRSGAHTVRATYDPDLGVPLDFWIDYSEQIADEELGMRVTEEVAALP